jgi:hypothetical protein
MRICRVGGGGRYDAGHGPPTRNTAVDEDPKMTAVETYRRHNMWHNRMQGEDSDLSSHVVRSQAIAEGRLWARTRGCDHVVLSADGNVESVTPSTR